MLDKLIWIAFLFFLFIAVIGIFIILQGISKKHKEVKKECALSTKTRENGHSGRMKEDVERELVYVRIAYISFICIFIAIVYAVVDCFMHIIE